MIYLLFMIGIILVILGAVCFRKADFFISAAISISVITISITASVLENNEIVIGTF